MYINAVLTNNNDREKHYLCNIMIMSTLYVCMYMCVYLYVSICLFVCVCICACVCVCACMVVHYNCMVICVFKNFRDKEKFKINICGPIRNLPLHSTGNQLCMFPL